MPVPSYVFDNTAPVPVPVDFVPDAAAPVAVALPATALSNTAPVGKVLSFAPDNGAPDAIALPATAFNNGAPVAKALDFARDATEPDAVALGDFTLANTPPTPIGVEAVPILLPKMSSIFTPAFVEISGSASALDQLNAAAPDEGRIIQGTVGGQLKSYQVRAGTEATDAPGLVRPANFNAATNAFVFVQL